MAMVDMTKIEADNSMCRPVCCDNAPTIWLNEAQCEALGITADVKAGAEIGIQAIACVTRVTHRVEGGESGEEPDVEVSLKITSMSVGKQRNADVTKTLYSQAQE